MTTTTTGHTLTIDAAALTMSIAGDLDTMDAIPDAELAAAAAAEGLVWTGEALDATSYRLAAGQDYTVRTDAGSFAVVAQDAAAALAQAVRRGEWAQLDSTREARDIADGAWLTVFDADGVPVLRRGSMP